ncbi:MAG: trypsin-like serine protease [Deltaproteobacteria bacterium]|nr:trypsin-like serine protease [Deltaproteobacteria bacterium]
MKRRLWVVAVLVSLGCGCGEALLAPVEGTPAAVDSQIVGGAVDPQHPFVGWLRVSGRFRCTATLIGKKTALTAARCITASASETSLVVGGRSFPAETITVHPRWDSEAADGEGEADLAIVQLKRTATVQPRPLSSTPSLAVGDAITLLGYGTTGDEVENSGTRRLATNRVSGLGLTKLYWAPETSSGSTCQGDSGGPILAADGALVGVISGGVVPCEFGFGWATRLAPYLDWIRSLASDAVAEGTAPADTQKPRVRIGSPKSHATVAVGPISVRATVSDDVAVARGELWVDGELVQTLASGPFDFTASSLGTGAHQLRVYGFDAAGNRGQYTIQVVAR